MKTAIVGLGVIGKVHAEILAELGAEITAVCDVDESKISNYPYAKYTEYEKMLKEIKPDVVHICTPHYLHADMIVSALSLGINVLCEKPLCISEEEMTRILEAEEKSSAILGVCLQNRYLPETVYLKKEFEDKKELCGMATLCWNRGKEYYASGDWRGRWKTEGGGVLINQALHTLDLMQWILGYPKSVTANVCNLTLKGDIEVEDTASIIFKTEKGGYNVFATNGSKHEFLVNLNLYGDDRNYSVNLSSGKVYIDGETLDFGEGKRFYGKCCYGSGHKGLFEDFYDCVKNKKKFSIDGKEASNVMKIIFAIYQSNNNEINLY